MGSDENAQEIVQVEPVEVVWRVTMWHCGDPNEHVHVYALDGWTAIRRAQAQFDAEHPGNKCGAIRAIPVEMIPDDERTAEDIAALDQSIDELTMDASAYAPEM